MALTDVSGRGTDAASRALLLSGAFGGLLGSLEPKAFLPAANGYLLRQNWGEGFATSIHLVLDLDSGDYELFSAGHPPALQRSTGMGRWEQKTAQGTLLGLDATARFASVKGSLCSGDVLTLFTDGLIETPDGDIDDGIDRLAREAGPLRSRRFPRRGLVPHRGSGQGSQRRPSPHPDLPRRPDSAVR